MTLLFERLRACAERVPDAEAIVHAHTRTGYATLWREASAFARFLLHERIGRGERVALLLANGAAYVAAYYGTLGAGAVAVALNTAAKAGELAQLIAHCGARWLVIDGEHPEAASLIERCRPRTRVIGYGLRDDAGSVRWEDIAASAPESTSAMPSLTRDDPAAIIYTSGTTGHPKGVVLSHGNLASNVDSILAYLPIAPGSRSVNVLPFYYSYGNSVLHTHIARGGCLILEENMVYPHTVVERLVAERADGFAGVPSTYALLLSRVSLSAYDLSSLRYLTQAGGAMPVEHIRRLTAQLPRAQFFVMYGQTEATARIAYVPPTRLHEKPGSCGIPIPGVTVELRRDDGALAATGEVGEICVHGPNVMRGYWGDAAATQAAVRGGWLHTGDLARRDAEGFLYIQGRRSDLIKTGAHRVHPAEIEEVIAAMPQIAEAVVVGVDDAVLGQAIKAVVLLRAGVAMDALQLKAHCRDRLATYKIPKYVEFVCELPKTASGKVKRYLLAGAGGAQA